MTESSAVLMQGGAVIAAAEQERFTRIKHDGGIPYAAIANVLEQAQIEFSDVDTVAVYWNPYNLAYRLRWMSKLALTKPSEFVRKFKRGVSVLGGDHVAAEDSGWLDILRIKSKLARVFGYTHPDIRFIDHHMTHMTSCFYGSGFDEAAILIMDGAGEAACTTTAVGKGTTIEVLDEHLLPHSLGHYYSSITGYLGFKMLDGEYKLMGLSPYGDTSGAKWIRDNYLVTPKPGRYAVQGDALDYHRSLAGDFSGKLQDHFGPARPCREDVEFTDTHRDIAASAQRAFEEVVLDLAENLQRRTGMKRLVIAGGCGLNCVANGQILRHGVFEEIYVPPVSHDAGGALGAAMWVYQQETGKRPEPVTHAQYGPGFSDQQIETALNGHKDLNWEKLDDEQLFSRGAEALAKGEVLTWFQGRMEFGPRALGNRSFLADPRSDSIRDVINEKIKKRELFRPFAPSVKAERATEYFDINQPSPFMTIIVPVRDTARDKIPAVTHVDGTARPQTVERETNPRYWQLLDQFEKKTGVACLLNTSFNIQEPIVCTPGEALNTFGGSLTDALLIGNYWVTHA